MIRKSLMVFISILLIVSPFFANNEFQNASASTSGFQLLVIVDKNNTSLPSFPSNVKVTKMEMKAFVASRQQLDGMYDGIYIHKGSYSSIVPTIDPPLGGATLTITNANDRRAHYQTSNQMNDITRLKANEIIQSFIQKGQPVVLHENIFEQSCTNTTLPAENRCVLKTSFEPYRNNYSNVKIYKDGDFPILVDNRPEINLLERPIEYENENSSFVYNAGDEINFSFLVGNTNQENSTVAQLYIDTDYNSRFDSKDLIVEKKLSELQKVDNKYTLTYKVPRGFSGIRIWKLEITDTTNRNVKDFETGEFRFRGDKVQVNVLQITRDSNNAGNLGHVLNSDIIVGKSKIVNNSGATIGATIETADMKININIDDLDNFNKNTYKTINGKYNMLIFGFQDEYGSTDISTAATLEVKKFMDTNQSVFLTHDTLRRDRVNGGNTLSNTNNWFKLFMERSAQTIPIVNNSKAQTDTPTSKPSAFFMETNLGRGGSGIYDVTNAKQVNQGLRTEFPYKIGDISTSSTHAQYFALDLNNKEVMPWYNLDNAGFDDNDSYNHYYAYSIGPLTYSGAGHTNSSFSGDEQKLFVNLMYQSFLGSNHVPFITTYTPSETGAVANPTKNLDVVYKLEDLDLSDFGLQTKVYVKGIQNPSSISYKEAYTGSTIHESIDKSLLQGDKITVVIEAIDQAGAKVTKEIEVSLKRDQVLVNANRSFAENNTSYLKFDTLSDTPTSIDYTVGAQKLDPREFSGEKLYPFAIDSSSAQVGSIITLPDEPFGGSNKSFVDLDSAQTFEHEVENGYNGPEYNIGDSVKFVTGYKTSSWKDSLESYIGKELIIPVINSKDKISIFAKVLVKSISGKGSNTRADAEIIGYKDSYTSNPTLKNITITEVFPRDIEVVNVPNGFTVSTNANGTTVRGSVQPFTYDQNGNPTGQSSQSFSISVKPTKDGVYLLNNSKVMFETPNGENASFDFDALTLEAETSVKSVKILESDLNLNLNDSPKLLTAEVLPREANQGVIWSSSDSTIVKVEQNGSITPLKAGKATITAKSIEYDATKNPNLIDTIVVTVAVPVEGVTVNPSVMKIKQGESKQINASIQPLNATNQNVSWSVADSSIATVNGTGKSVNITGLKLGVTTITVRTSDGNKSAEVTVRVIPNLTISPGTMTLQVGESMKFSSNLSDSLVDWSISNNAIAEISSSGVVTGKAKGETKVTVYYKEDRSVFFEATLIVEANLVSIQLPTKVNILVGESVQLIPTVEPGRPSDYDFTWQSANSTIATISNDGSLKGIILGKTIVTVTERFTGKTAQSEVTVVEEYTEENPPLSDDSVRW
ncbi:DUF5057 domain-containing protein [Bacillus sp. DJP31]|uniref:DUF5057 domain-containing protein n=1 Tax=Bacillus sp. DJP31 TaxID=3409789 RepID=UPI003BB7B11F